MKEEIIKKLYEEYRHKCLNEMFERKEPTNEELVVLIKEVDFYKTYDFSDREMTEETREKIIKKWRKKYYFYLCTALKGFYYSDFLCHEDVNKTIIYNFLGKKIYTHPKKVDVETTENGYCIIKEKNFIRDGEDFCRLIDINGLTLLKAVNIKYIGNDIYAKKVGDVISLVNVKDEEIFYYRKNVSSVNGINEIYLEHSPFLRARTLKKFSTSPFKGRNGVIKYCGHYYYYYGFSRQVLFDSSLRKIDCDNYYQYLIYNERRECNINDNDIQKRFNGCLLKNKNIKLKYKPIYEYQNHIICGDDENYYLYNIKENRYYRLGFRDDIVFYAGLIIDKLERTVHYLDSGNDDYIDVTSIFESKLKGAYKINYTKLDMLDYFEFKSLIENNSEYQVIIDRKIEELLKQKEEILKKEAVKKATRMLEERKKEKDNNNEELKKALLSLKETIITIEKLQAKDDSNQNIRNKEKITITGDMLLRTVSDHKVIDENFKKILRTFNLVNINFINVDIREIDFSYTNVDIDPQTVYNKDLSNSKFCGVLFSPFTNFNGVNIKGCDFSECLETLNFNGAIIDENTIFPNSNVANKNISR